MNFIDLKRQYQAYRKEIDQAVLGVMDSTHFILGQEVEALERELSGFTGAPFAVGVSSGTDGLLLSLMALGAEKDTVIITTPFSFFATAEAIMLLGAEPAFCDIERESFNLDPHLLEDRINELEGLGKKVLGVIVVSIYGQCADMDAINRISKKRGLFVIEDACQSLGASYKGRMSGNLSLLSVTSFFPSKPLGCFGDGGMVFSQDEHLFEKIKAMRIHGDRGRYDHRYLGLNARLDAIQAAVLRAKLRHFEEEITLRQEASDRYMDLLSPLERKGMIGLPHIKKGCRSVFAQFTIRILEEDRDQVARALSELGIPTAIHYPRPLPLLEPLKRYGFRKGEFLVAEEAARQVLSLPMHAFIEEREQEEVARALFKVLDK